MPDYRKKKHKTIIRGKSKSDFNETFEIKIDNKTKNDFLKTPKVIVGNKEKKKLRIKIALCVFAVILITIFIANLLFPVGIIETFSNYVSSIGSDEYPINITGSNVLNVVPNNNYFYVLSDTNLSSISNSGKVIESVNHGFSAPVLKASNTRVLIYDQGQTGYNLFSVNKKILTKTTKSEIICADICDSGSFAIATLSDAYASTFSVYDKSGNSVFTWNCAKETITSISLSPNGKKIAASTISALNGELFSKVYLFSLDKTDADKSFDYATKSIYSLYSNKKGIFVVSNSGYDFIAWKSFNKSENSTELSVEFFRNYSSNSICVLNRKNNRSDNTVILLNKNGEKISNFSFKGNISDIRKNGSHIYLISNADIFIYDLKGNLIASKKCGYDFRYIVSTGSRCVNVISDNAINQINVK